MWAYLFTGLADYHRRRNVKAFVECLSLVLNTGQKRKLLIPIRDAYIKPSDLSKFNQMVQALGLATSHRQKHKLEEKSNTDNVRRLEVKRDADGQWGFSIRGGSEHGIGIFVSWIEPDSNAEKCGLQVGDQILKANDTNFERINHHDAVMVIIQLRLGKCDYYFLVTAPINFCTQLCSHLIAPFYSLCTFSAECF